MRNRVQKVRQEGKQYGMRKGTRMELLKETTPEKSKLEKLARKEADEGIWTKEYDIREARKGRKQGNNMERNNQKIKLEFKFAAIFSKGQRALTELVTQRIS